MGGSRKGGELGRAYFDALNRVYSAQVPGGADLVCYWFHKSRQQIVSGQLKAAGLVTTQAIRAGSNRKVLSAIDADSTIFEAWSDEPWVNEGAAVRVSLIAFGHVFGSDRHKRLDGKNVDKIRADLSATEGVDLTKAQLLPENFGASFEGVQKNGPYDIPADVALSWLCKPNPNGRPNADVLRPYKNAKDIAARSNGDWLIDFTGLSENEASLYELPFNHVLKVVKPEREKKTEAYLRDKYWLLKRPAPDFRKQVALLERYIVTPRVAKHRYFVWLSVKYLPDSRLNAITKGDDATFGILSSRIHLIWALANASMHGVGKGPTYNNQSCFQTFPFPSRLTPRDTANVIPSDPVAEKIAVAARRLNELRENWLNPPEWVEWVITPEEEKAGFPKRPVAKAGHEADLKKRTLTNLYNARPTWLANAHRELDHAVAAAYGWDADISDDEVLRRLLELNKLRSSGGEK